ncbi:MAG: GspH/FimT family pseudopilin [Gammaproteobacteria bacterium]
MSGKRCLFQTFKSTLGITLIELLVVLSVVAVISALAGTSFRNLIEDTDLLKEQRLLVKFFKLARGEAISRGYPVTVCRVASETQENCTSTSDNSAFWLMIALEPNANSFDQSVLKRIQIDDVQVTANATQFVFEHTGHLRTTDPSNPNTFTATLCRLNTGTSFNQRILEVISSGVITLRDGARCL